MLIPFPWLKKVEKFDILINLEFTDWRVKPDDYDLKEAAIVIGEGIDHETAMMNASFELVKKRAKEQL